MCFKRIFKWTIFSYAADRLAKKISSCVESYDYVEAYDVMWSVLTYSGIYGMGDRMAQKCPHT